MKGKTHSTEEIIRILRQADGGETAQAICREHNISEQTFYRLSCSFSFFKIVSEDLFVQRHKCTALARYSL